MTGNEEEMWCWRMRKCDYLTDVGHYIVYLIPLSYLILKITMQGTHCFVYCAIKTKT